jgi:hypothetical protein
MAQNQKNIAMPKEWYDQLQQLASSYPARKHFAAGGVMEDEPKAKRTVTAALQKLIFSFRS